MKKLLYFTAIYSLFFAFSASAQEAQKTVYDISDAKVSLANGEEVEQNTAEDEALKEKKEQAKKMQETVLKRMKESSFKEFSAMDENKDGKVSKDEFLNAKIKKFTEAQIKVFDGIDLNKDGSISDAEYDKAIENAFNEMNKTLIETFKKMKKN